MKFNPTMIEACAAKKSDRFQRTNIMQPYLDAENSRLMATDGHKLVICPVEVSADDVSGPISADAIKAARVAKRTVGDAEIACNGSLAVTGGPTFPRDENITFPDVGRVVPDTAGSKAYCIDAAYLLQIAKAINEDRKSTAVILHIPEDANTACKVTTISGESYGVIMPVRI